MSKTAKVLYTPFGTVASIAAGAVASAVFGKIWSLARREDEPPEPRDRDRSVGEILTAAVLRGAVFAGTQAAADRFAARAFARWSGEWPA